MFQNINQKQIENVMKRMGISQTNLDAKRVIIELEDSSIIIDEPSVTRVKMQGQETFQVSGVSRTEEKLAFSEDDVKMVIEKTGASKEDVVKFLGENRGDIAFAIMELRRSG